MDYYPPTTHHDGILLFAAINARDSARRDLENRHDRALTSDAIGAVVIAAAAAEAFINELPGRIRVARDRGTNVSAEMLACADAVEQLAKIRRPTCDKYQRAARELSGQEFATDAAPFQEFQLLFQVRNAIMHPKPIPSEEMMSALKARGLTTDRRAPAEGNDRGLTWLDRLQEPSIATWACQVAHQTMLAILDMVARHSPEALDTVTSWLRDRGKFPT